MRAHWVLHVGSRRTTLVTFTSTALTTLAAGALTLPLLATPASANPGHTPIPPARSGPGEPAPAPAVRPHRLAATGPVLPGGAGTLLLLAAAVGALGRGRVVRPRHDRAPGE